MFQSTWGILIQMPFWLLLLPLTILLAWQDWKARQVNAGVVLATLLSLILNIQYFSHVLGVFCILWIYKYFRKNSIQIVDIALFSAGAGCFSLTFLSAYCIITAFILAIIFRAILIKKLPFLTAWVMGFWVTYFMQFCLNH